MAIVFTDMELDDEDRADLAYPCAEAPNKKLLPKYPYGLCISLTDKEMEKLSLDPSEAKQDGMIHFHALAQITSTSTNTTADGKTHHRIELQIQQMAVESEDKENKEAEAAVPRRKMRAVYEK